MSGLILMHGVLTQAPDPFEVEPALGVAPFAMRVDDLILVASELASSTDPFADPESAGRLALGHHRVLARLAATEDLAPISFPAAAKSRQEAASLIRARAEALRAALARVAGAVEYAARLIVETDIETAEPSTPEPLDGRSYLAARRDKLAARRERIARRETFIESAEQTLAAFAREALRLPLRKEGEPRALDLALLTPRDQVEALVAAGERVWNEAPGFGLRFELSGPWPPYSFAGDESPDGMERAA